MGFNEMVHAFIAARYYHRLTEDFAERGRQTFIHATQYYASQRGRRMAQRAIRDGKELNYGTYMEYGEWLATNEVEQMGFSNQSEVLSSNPDYVLKIKVCPWYEQFRRMNAKEAGKIYCKYLDEAICRGFNPDLIYWVQGTLHDSDCCIHVIKNTCFKENEAHPKKIEYVKNFEYHCAHMYWSYAETVQAVFKEKGKETVHKVLEDIIKEYGKEMAEDLLKYKDINFNVSD